MSQEVVYDDSAGVCLYHQGQMITAAAQNCPECDIQTTNGSYKRCANCALKRNKCSLCDGPLIKLGKA